MNKQMEAKLVKIFLKLNPSKNIVINTRKTVVLGRLVKGKTHTTRISSGSQTHSEIILKLYFRILKADLDVMFDDLVNQVRDKY